MSHNLLSSSSFGKHLSCSHALVIMDTATANTHGQAAVYHKFWIICFSLTLKKQGIYLLFVQFYLERNLV